MKVLNVDDTPNLLVEYRRATPETGVNSFKKRLLLGGFTRGPKRTALIKSGLRWKYSMSLLPRGGGEMELTRILLETVQFIQEQKLRLIAVGSAAECFHLPPTYCSQHPYYALPEEINLIEAKEFIHGRLV